MTEWESVHIPGRPEPRTQLNEMTGEVKPAREIRRGNPSVRDGAPLIGILVDRSGSMASCLDGMQTGLNEFVREQAELPGDAAVMLSQFDTLYESVWPIRPAKGAPAYQLQPRGRTALLDAIGEFVNEVADTLGEDERYRPVIACIVTDGLENASKEWTRPAVRDLIAYWRDNYRWSFVFLGANMDAVAEAGGFGIGKNAALTFDTRHARASYRVLSRHVRELRAGHAASFTEQDRRKAIGR